MSPTVAALLLLSAGASPPPAPHVAFLPGGLELVVVPVERADTASLRYVVRSGSARDPVGKEGLAHVLEHLLVRDAKVPLGLVEASKAAGATLNAFTSRDSTVYVLDAPAAAFEGLAEAYLRAITDPVLPHDSIDRELGVVQSEADHHRGGELAKYVEDTLFRSSPHEGTPLGDARTRRGIERKDVLEFFQRNYATANTTLVFTGAVTEASVRALLDRAFLLPPSTPGEQVAPKVAAPSLPLTEKVRAPFIVAVLGFRLDPADLPACEALASLIELRMLVALRIREQLIHSASVGCYAFRGSDFLLAMAYAPTLEASDLPLTMEEIFRAAAGREPSAQERRLLERRLERLREELIDDPGELADAFGWAAARPREAGRTDLPRLSPRPLPIAAMRATARRAFTPQRRVLLLLSPFEG